MSEKGWVRPVSVVLALVGLWVVIKSTSLGLQATDALVHANFGQSFASEIYNRILVEAIAGYRFLGAVLVAVGLHRALT